MRPLPQQFFSEMIPLRDPLRFAQVVGLQIFAKKNTNSANYFANFASHGAGLFGRTSRMTKLEGPNAVLSHMISSRGEVNSVPRMDPSQM